jgi:hypothetical protein
MQCKLTLAISELPLLISNMPATSSSSSRSLHAHNIAAIISDLSCMHTRFSMPNSKPIRIQGMRSKTNYWPGKAKQVHRQCTAKTSTHRQSSEAVSRMHKECKFTKQHSYGRLVDNHACSKDLRSWIYQKEYSRFSLWLTAT